MIKIYSLSSYQINVLAFFWAKKTNVIGCFFSSIVGIWSWFLGLASDTKPTETENHRWIVGWTLPGTPQWERYLCPQRSSSRRGWRLEEGKPVTWPLFWWWPPIKLWDSRILGMSFWERCAKMSSHISSLYLVYTCISRNIPKKSPSNGRTVFVFSTATKTTGVSHVIWDSSTCTGNYSNWLISFHKNSHSFQCIMHIYYSAYITNESFLVEMGPLPLVGGGNSNNFYFHPENWGNDEIWRAYFSNGWRKTTN